jgi:WD40 repeat protein
MKESDQPEALKPPEDRATAFISYAREEKNFVLRLDESLRLKGINVSGDWLLVRGMNYEEQLQEMLLGADAFIFVLSQSSARSPACQEEINQAVELKKRILPVVYRDCEGELHPALSKPQWTFLREEDDFVTGVQELIAAINTDFDLMPEHRRLLSAAETWQKNGRLRAYLLRKEGLKSAVRWLSRTSEQPNKLPKPTSLQSEYILASQRNHSRGTRIAFGIVVAIALALSVLAVVALAQRGIANRNADEARRQQAIATKNAVEAEQQRNRAEENATEAKHQQKQAEANATEAKRQQKQAEANATEAQRNAKEAERQAGIARTNELEAKHQQTVAEERRAEAERQRQLAVEATQVQQGEKAAVLGQQPGREFESLAAAVQASEPTLKSHHASMPAPVIAGLSAAVKAAAYSLPLRGHTDQVVSAAFSADGTRLLTSSEDGTERLWDTAGGKVIKTLPHRTIQWHAVSFTKDSRFFVTLTDGRAAELWDARTGEPRRTIWTAAGQIKSAMFSHDGARIITAGAENTPLGGSVQVWNVETGKLLLTLRNPDKFTWGEISFAAFSPDDRRIISTHQDDNARLWNADTGEMILQFGAGHPLRSGAFSPDGSRVVLGGNLFDVTNGKHLATLNFSSEAIYDEEVFSPDGLYVAASGGSKPEMLDARTGQPVKPLLGGFGQTYEGHSGDINYAAFSPASPDGSRTIVTVSQDQTARLWDVNSGDLLATLRGHADRVWHAAFSSDGKYIVTTSADRTARLWTLRPDRSLATLGEQKFKLSVQSNGSEVNFATFSPSDGALVLTAHNDGAARLWKSLTGQLLAKIDLGEPAEVAAFSPDGSRLAIGSKKQTLLWDTQSGKQIARLEGRITLVQEQRDHPPSTPFSPDGAFVLTSAQEEWLMWNARTGQPVRRAPSHQIKSAIFSPDGKFIVEITDYGNYVELIDARTGQHLHILARNGSFDNFISFSPDSSRVVVQYSPDEDNTIPNPDHTVLVKMTQTGDTLLTLVGHTDVVKFASFSPDGRKIVTASADHTARVWDAQTGNSLVTLVGHTGEVISAVFSPDGKQVLTISYDETARLWDARTGYLLDILQGHMSRINSAMFSPDGARIITASNDGTAKLYSAVENDLVQEFLTRAFNLLHAQ